MTDAKPKLKDKRPLCRCHVWSFPHRLSVTLCEPDEDAMARLYLTHRALWEQMVDRMDADEPPEPRGCTRPGSSHFDSDADYWAARNSR
jgi:hypothetical protein